MRYKKLLEDTSQAEQHIAEEYRLLKELNDYCAHVLEDEALQPDKLPFRKAYHYLLFVFAASLTDSIISLAEKGQARAAALEARGLWETWVNTRFIYCSRNHIWAHYLIATGEIDRLEMLAQLLAAGKITDIAAHKKRVKIAKMEVNYIKRKYQAFPVIPGVINTSSSSFITKHPASQSGYKLRSLSIKDRCKIVDYYNTLYPSRHYKSASAMALQYEMVYRYYSNFVHVSPIELNNLFERLPSGKLAADIGGTQDRRNLDVILHHAYTYHRELLEAFTKSLAKKNTQVPAGLPRFLK